MYHFDLYKNSSNTIKALHPRTEKKPYHMEYKMAKIHYKPEKNQ